MNVQKCIRFWLQESENGRSASQPQRSVRDIIASSCYPDVIPYNRRAISQDVSWLPCVQHTFRKRNDNGFLAFCTRVISAIAQIFDFLDDSKKQLSMNWDKRNQVLLVIILLFLVAVKWNGTMFCFDIKRPFSIVLAREIIIYSRKLVPHPACWQAFV